MSKFYQQYGRLLALFVLLMLPLLTNVADSLPANNDIETWLPQNSAVRNEYEEFKELFGGEEAVLIGLPTSRANSQLIEAVAARVEQLQGVRSCWTPDRLVRAMGTFGIREDAARERLKGLILSQEEEIAGIFAVLSETGLQNRDQTVAEVKEILDYSQLSQADILLSGAPVIVAELNELGGPENSKLFFISTLVICFALLIYSTRHWRLSAAVLIETIFAIQLTLSLVNWWGGEMNFILSALPVMVMVFTMANAIHLIHYYRNTPHSPDRLGQAIRKALKPCLLATFTTAIGLLSLMISEIVPVKQFGIAAALGAFISCLCGLGLTPIAITFWPQAINGASHQFSDFAIRLSYLIVNHRRRIALASCLALLISAGGLMLLASRVDPLDFLPRQSAVVNDFLEIEERLTNIDSIEAVVDFGTSDLSFTDKLQRVKLLESRLAEHENVKHTMSLASFFPDPLPSSGLELIQLLSTARASKQGTDYVSAGERYWRISSRIQGISTDDKQRIFLELRESLKGEPVTLTGVAPLIKQAQDQIFVGFWESFASALLIIMGVMMLALRSIKTAAVAMIPNIAPLCLVFGCLGWFGVPVDIGMMMTASIALGIAVDGTFHFLVAYRDRSQTDSRPSRNSLGALLTTGEPIFQAALFASVGMLALTQSQFIPTVRFGLLMSTLLATAVFADLVLLPCLLGLGSRRSRNSGIHQPVIDVDNQLDQRIAA